MSKIEIIQDLIESLENAVWEVLDTIEAAKALAIEELREMGEDNVADVLDDQLTASELLITGEVPDWIVALTEEEEVV